MIDSLQINELLGIDYLSMGYEKSADEGNGVFWRSKEVIVAYIHAARKAA